MNEYCGLWEERGKRMSEGRSRTEGGGGGGRRRKEERVGEIGGLGERGQQW